MLTGGVSRTQPAGQLLGRAAHVVLPVGMIKKLLETSTVCAMLPLQWGCFSVCECNASVLKCIHLKINNSKNVSGSWGISGCLKLPRVCRCLRGPAMSTGCGGSRPGPCGLGTVILVRGGGGGEITQLDCCWRTWWPAQSRQMLWARQTSGAEAVSLGCFTSLSGEASGTLLSSRGWALGRTLEHSGTSLQ